MLLSRGHRGREVDTGDGNGGHQRDLQEQGLTNATNQSKAKEREEKERIRDLTGWMDGERRRCARPVRRET